MPEQVTITVDGMKMSVPKGRAVLDLALEYGICIPHLCHVPGLSDFGGCRLCIVEVVNGDKAKVTASCTLEAREGLAVRTNSEKVRRLRKNLAELLVAEAPNSRAIQDMALRCGVRTVRYTFHNADCVLCGRCVRYCEEMAQVRAIGFIGRGKARHVDYAFGVRPDDCKDCGVCLDQCPMNQAPCPGYMKAGEEQLCARCEGQMLTFDKGDNCLWCEMGKGFQCTRQTSRQKRRSLAAT